MEMPIALHLLLAGAFLGMAAYCYVRSLFLVMIVDDPYSHPEDFEFLKAVFFFVIFVINAIWLVKRMYL